jgi:predicted metal-dependent peptidase
MKKPEDKALERAKIQLMQIPLTVFYTTVLFSLKQSWRDTLPNGEPLKTAATDGTKLIINSEFFLGLSEPMRIGLLVHELGHVILSHMTRQGNRHHQAWNAAGDHVINLSIIETGNYQLPAGALKDTRFRDMCTEQVYDILYEEAEKDESTGGPGADGIAIPGGPDIQFPEDSTEAEIMEKAVADIILKASIQAKAANQMPGELPGEVGIHLQNVLNPKLPWNVILQNYLTGFAKDDYSWKRPNRRYLPEYYLPSSYSEAVERIAVAVDSSGSVEMEEFSYFITEIDKMQELLKPEEILVIDFDTKIRNIQTLARDTDIFSELTFTGGGGTDVQEVFEWAIENDPVVLLIFTDGEFYMPETEYLPTCPIIWLIHSNPYFTSPIGEIIHYDIGE